MKSFRIIFFGQVQGVGFRATVYRIARNKNLHGTVRNKLDGTVEVILNGTKNDAANLVSEISVSNSPFIKIEKTSISEIESPKYEDFNIIS